MNGWHPVGAGPSIKEVRREGRGGSDVDTCRQDRKMGLFA